MTDRIPVDSTEARELAEQRHAMEHERFLRQRDHDTRCVRGWLGEDDDGRPIPCLICRSHLLAGPCRTCGVIAALCDSQVARARGRCCTDCNHDRARSDDPNHDT